MHTVTMTMPAATGYRYTGEFRPVQFGEYYLGLDSHACKWSSRHPSNCHYPILAREIAR